MAFKPTKATQRLLQVKLLAPAMVCGIETKQGDHSTGSPTARRDSLWSSAESIESFSKSQARKLTTGRVESGFPKRGRRKGFARNGPQDFLREHFVATSWCHGDALKRTSDPTFFFLGGGKMTRCWTVCWQVFFCSGLKRPNLMGRCCIFHEKISQMRMVSSWNRLIKTHFFCFPTVHLCPLFESNFLGACLGWKFQAHWNTGMDFETFNFKKKSETYWPESSKGLKFEPLNHQKQTWGLKFDPLGGSRELLALQTVVHSCQAGVWPAYSCGGW